MIDCLNSGYEPRNRDPYPNGSILCCAINSEIGAVLAVMRRNVRWGGRYISGEDQIEQASIQSFKSLRKEIFTWKHRWHTVSPALYLRPFLDLVRSDDTGAPITGVALSSVYKILTLDAIDPGTTDVTAAMHLLVDAVTSCRFEVTDPASEEVVLMKILQVLLACVKSKASVVLSNQHVCLIVKTCFHIIHQAGTKGELLQRMARHTMHELLRCIFSRLPEIEDSGESAVSGTGTIDQESTGPNNEHAFETRQMENGSTKRESQSQTQQTDPDSTNTSVAFSSYDSHMMNEPFGVPCMVEIFHFLCSLLNVVEQAGLGSGPNTVAFDEDMPLFALTLINSAIELTGPSIPNHRKLLTVIKDELFRNLMQFGLSMNPLILSMICSVVLNLYQHMRTDLKLQIEAFFSCVILRLAQSRSGASYHQQEVAMEALVDFCRQKTFVVEMFANFDCDLTCYNVFEELANLLCKSAFPVNSPLSSTNVLALEGLVAVIQGMAERLSNESPLPEQIQEDFEEYSPFWNLKCDDYSNPEKWVPFVRRRKFIKTRLAIGADHFNHDPKKGLEFLQGTKLLPEKLDPESVACFLRYTSGLDKNLIGDLLGNHDPFYVRVLREFAQTFDFKDMSLDNALRLFLETFRLPGESQKIQRVLEAFSERYYDQSPEIFADKDAALLLSYSMILLNTDLHNAQVKKKMTEEGFIRNNRLINGGNDLPREFLSELYNSICKNEIRTIPEQGSSFPQMNPSRWIDLVRNSEKTSPYILSADSKSHLDRDMFAILAGPTIAAISVVFDHSEQEEIYQTCVDGFLSVAKISASYRFEDVLDDLVVSLCKFTNLLNPTTAFDEPVLSFSEDPKARIATVTVFTIANTYGDYIRSGWRNILDCILRLHKLGLLPDFSSGGDNNLVEKPPPAKLQSSGQNIQKKSSFGLMGRFSQFLSLDTVEPEPEPTEEELTSRKICLETVQQCRINEIFSESKFLQSESLLQLLRALISAAELAQREGTPFEDEAVAVFCLEILIDLTLNNRDRIVLLWQNVYDHIYGIVQSALVPCALAEKAVFGLLKICHRLLPYKENLSDELLKSLQIILKLDARVADAYCEQITQEVGRLVKANAAQIRSQSGWRTVASLLSTTARHPEAAESGFDALMFVMSDGTHLIPANFLLCVDTARQFAESRVGEVERSVRALELISGSADCLSRWAREARVEESGEVSRDIGEMWLRLVLGLKKVCLDQREEVRVHALLSLQKCLRGVDGIDFSHELWSQCFDTVIFSLLDDLLEIVQGKSLKEYRNIEATLVTALKISPKTFLHLLPGLSRETKFGELWLGVLTRIEAYGGVKIRGKRSEKLRELVPELLKSTLLVMKSTGVLSPGSSIWDSTWSLVNKVSPDLKSEVFPDQNSVKSPSGESQVHEATT